MKNVLNVSEKKNGLGKKYKKGNNMFMRMVFPCMPSAYMRGAL